MKKIVLVSCVGKKLSYKSKARDLYTSPLFKKSLQYARSLQPDKIFILSAKHGLLDLNQEITPYNQTLNEKSSEKIKKWSKDVLNQLKKVSDIKNDEFIFLAGKNYRKHLLPNLNNYKIPMEGLGIGEQLKWLSERIKK